MSINDIYFPCFNGLSFIRIMFPTTGATPYMVIWGIPTPLSNVSSVKIRNKHNCANCQPIITNVVPLPMFSTSIFHLRAFPESQGGYMWQKWVFPYPKAQQPF